MATKIVVIGPHCFGEGATIAAAKRSAKDACPSWVDRRHVRFVAYECPPSTRVNTMGNLSFRPNEGRPIYIGSV